MSFPITLESLSTQHYTKKQIQDENVKHGLARCDNELKAKSVQKLRNYLLSLIPLPSLPPSQVKESAVPKQKITLTVTTTYEICTE
jgi:hypothetical protein